MHDAHSASEPLLAELAALRQQYAALAAALVDQQRAERESDALPRPHRGFDSGYCHSPQFHPLFANQAYATILGYESPDDIIKMGSLLPIFPPAERARLTGYVQARQEGRSVSGNRSTRSCAKMARPSG